MRLIYLVRHGQASFGKRDYDALSDLGHEQSRLLGRALAVREIVPDVVIRGELRRHRETADGILAGMADVGNTSSIPVEVDAGWDEFDFEHVVQVHKPMYRSRAVMLADLVRSRAPREKFQAIFEDATARWTSGESDHSYRESFPAFAGRIQAALLAAAAQTPEKGTAVVVTSGGPIGLAVSHLLAGDASLWVPLNKVAVNSAVTKVINGRNGLTLSSYNDHSHVEHDRRLLTYR